jgi:two-component system cell cycle sensor histidine kinase PleC
MAGTTSATRQQSYVPTAALAASQRQIFTSLALLGRGDLTRGIIAVAALFLTAIGFLAPRIDAEALAAFLFLSAAGLALIAASGHHSHGLLAARPEEYDSLAQTSPQSEPHAPAHRVRPLQRTLVELLSLSDARGAAETAQWSRLTHRMSHELRTPLNAVIGFSDLMTSEVFGPLGSEQYRDYAASINKSGRTLLKSAEDALAITNLLTSDPLKARDPITSVRGAIADMEAFHKIELAGLAIAWDIDAELDIVGEAQTLRQILINLMAEALDHATPDAGLTVATAATGDEVYLTLTLDCPGARKAGGEDSFALMLARTLMQLSQARLEEASEDGRWSATAIFPRAVQRDFFALG